MKPADSAAPPVMDLVAGPQGSGKSTFFPVADRGHDSFNVNESVRKAMTTRDRITIDADVMQGKAVIRGTPITVGLVLRKRSEGATEANLLDAYPHLTAEDVRAALAYAADAVSHEDIVLTAPSGSSRS